MPWMILMSTAPRQIMRVERRIEVGMITVQRRVTHDARAASALRSTASPTSARTRSDSYTVQLDPAPSPRSRQTRSTKKRTREVSPTRISARPPLVITHGQIEPEPHRESIAFRNGYFCNRQKNVTRHSRRRAGARLHLPPGRRGGDQQIRSSPALYRHFAQSALRQLQQHPRDRKAAGDSGLTSCRRRGGVP